MSDYPTNCRYTKEHEWARLEGDVVVVGITAHAVEQLGDITLVTLPEPGTALSQGDSFGDVDSVKTVSELYSPVDGEISERNDALEDSPETVNDDPHGAGWFVKMTVGDSSKVQAQLAELMDAAAYAKFVAES